MANIDGLPVNSAVTHAEFMSRTEDTSTTGSVNFQNVTESTSSTTGAIKTAGGLGVAKSLNVGLDAEIGGTLTVQTNLDVNGVATVVGTLNTADIAASGNINTTLDMSASNILAVGNVEAQTEMITPLLSATVADVGTLNLTNAFTAPSLTVTTDATINGNLTVNGTTVTLNTATVDSEDPNITVNKTGNDASSEGAGFTVDRTGTKGSLVYANALASKFKIGDLASEAEVVTVSHTQTLTNKTLTSPVLTTPSTDIISATEQGSTPATPASGVRKLYPKADGFYQLDSTGLETKVGSGSGGGGVVNLITNGSADDAIASIFTPYADAAGTRPVDGTGGSPTVTTSISAVSPLTGTKSYLLTKPASNTQGQGWAVATIPLDLSYRAKALKISVDYVVNSGTFVAGSRTTDSDIIWTCYDITNSKIVEPSNIKMFASSTTISEKFEATVQFDYNCTSFRLMAHVATTSTAAYEIKVDNVTVSPSVSVYGTPITDWQSYTPTFTSFGTVTGASFSWRRVGSSAEIRGVFTTGTTVAAEARISLPSGLTSASTLPTLSKVGDMGSAATESASWQVNIEPNITYLTMAKQSSGAAGFSKGPGTSWNSSTAYSLVASVPIQGFSASTQMSDSADTRSVLSTSQIAAAATTTNGGIIQFNTVTKDTHGSITTGAAWKHTVAVPGDYRVSINMDVNIAANYQVYVNGVSQGYILSAPLSLYGFGQRTLPDLKSGDYIHFVSDTGGTVQAASYCTIERISGPSAIAASESVNCSYASSAGNTVGVADTLLLFATKQYDSHGAYNTSTGLFTAPIAGKYRISVTLTSASFTLATNQQFVMQIYKNGSVFRRPARTAGSGGAVNLGLCGSTTVDLLAGETISIYAGSSVATSLVAGAAENNFSIEKVG